MQLGFRLGWRGSSDQGGVSSLGIGQGFCLWSGPKPSQIYRRIIYSPSVPAHGPVVVMLMMMVVMMVMMMMVMLMIVLQFGCVHTAYVKFKRVAFLHVLHDLQRFRVCGL